LIASHRAFLSVGESAVILETNCRWRRFRHHRGASIPFRIPLKTVKELSPMAAANVANDSSKCLI
jgi:hypothetical protein